MGDDPRGAGVERRPRRHPPAGRAGAGERGADEHAGLDRRQLALALPGRRPDARARGAAARAHREDGAAAWTGTSLRRPAARSPSSPEAPETWAAPSPAPSWRPAGA